LLLHLRYSLSRKAIYLTALLVSLITLTALIVLSFLLTKETLKNNEQFARRSFLNKYDAIEFEFNNIANYQNVLKNVVDKSNVNSYKDHFNVLNELNNHRNLRLYNWYYSNKNSNNKNEFNYTSIGKPFNDKTELISEKLKQQKNSLIIHDKDSMYWVNYDSVQYNQSYFYYGSTINLIDLHDYFININKNSFNYVFVFDKEGYCITHPDEKFIGKNIFDFTTITPQDTLSSKTQLKYTEQKAISEYLTETEITRFIKPLKVDGFDGYVAVGYLNFYIEESVQPTKLYVATIFLATIFLISVIFLLFNLLTRKAFREKEVVSNEKNKLLIENEMIVKENALNQLKQLKNQINPHFLFNSLNTLYMTIGLNQKQAQRFTMNLSKIYRYLIVPPKENIVTVKKELEFIQQYMELQKSRFQEELVFNLIIKDEKSLKKSIPYLALQLVVENAIKHNIATIDSPLSITIELKKNNIVVSNTYQPINNTTDNMHFGLEYLEKMYAFYKTNTLRIKVKDGIFICKLTLIN
jgi:sensor histidine kinase YesM